MHRSRIGIIALTACLSGQVHAQSQSLALSEGDATVWARLLQMADGRRLDTALVGQALRSRVPSLQAAGVLAIGQIGRSAGAAGIPILRAKLASDYEAVAANAAYALGLLGDSGSVAALQSALSGRPSVARNAAWALGAVGAPGRAAILHSIANPAIHGAVKTHLLLAAGKLRPVPVTELRPFLASRSASLAWASAYAVARSRAVAGTRDMIALAANPAIAPTCGKCDPPEGGIPYFDNRLAPHRARAEVARMLVKGVTGDSLSGQAIPVLNRLMRDPIAHVRINAVRSLATYGKIARSEVTAALADGDANVRVAAAQVVGGVLDSVAASWTGLWARDTSFAYRTSLAASAAVSGVILAETAGWQNDSDWRYRAALAGALGSVPGRVAPDPVILRLISDRDARVRATALSALVPRDTMRVTSAIRGIVIRALADTDVDVRTAALDLLTRTPSSSELDAVLAAYERSRRDSASDARIAAVQYLAALWRRDSANFPQPARDRLARMTAPVDPLERAAAGANTLFASWPPVLPASRDLAWYQAIVNDLIRPALTGHTPRLSILTGRGPVVLELFALEAPLTVSNIMTLAASGYYSGTRFHRVVPNFVAQDGDPTGTGSGGPGYAIRDEMNPWRYERGVLGMALSGPDTGGSQYFITHSPQPHLDGGYTVFGRVISGWRALDAIVQGDLIKTVTIRK